MSSGEKEPGRRPLGFSECKRALYAAAASWLDASDLTDLNVPESIAEAEEARWERAKAEVVRSLYKRA